MEGLREPDKSLAPLPSCILTTLLVPPGDGIGDGVSVDGGLLFLRVTRVDRQVPSLSNPEEAQAIIAKVTDNCRLDEPSPVVS